MTTARSAVSAWVLCGLLSGAISTRLPAQTLPPAYDTLYEGLRHADADPERGVRVHDVVVQVDAGKIELDDGDLSLLKPIGGKTIGAVFIGRGRFSMTAPIAVERAQLHRFYGTDSLDVPIKTAVLLFSAGAQSVLFKGLDWRPLQPPPDARREIQEAMDYVTDGHGWIRRDVALSLLNGAADYFHAQVAESRGDPLLYTFNPSQAEEVSLARRSKAPGPKRAEVIAQFHKRADYASGRSFPQEAFDLIHTPHFDIDATIEHNLTDFSAKASVTVVRVAEGYRWIPFRLFGDLKVDSVLWEGGKRAVFASGRDATDIWVDFSSAPSDSTELTFFYGGKLFVHEFRLWTALRSEPNWYPLYEYFRPAVYRMTFHAPKGTKVVTVGRRLSESTEGGETTSTWQTPVVDLVTFNLGSFTEYDIHKPGAPDVRVEWDKEANAELFAMAQRANVMLNTETNMGPAVGTDVAASFAFYEDVFGKPPVDSVIATEIPGPLGLAYPGLILLSATTFMHQSEKGYQEIFRAHEVAHQWWGIGVEPATYHDRWLAEGFAEFSGLWYMARERGSLKTFYKRLDDMRKKILDRGPKTGPIWLGTRVADSEHPEDYQTIVYDKGAWVLNMLRSMLLDLNNGTDQRFRDMMHDFYTTYRGKRATTEDFEKVVERHFGGSMAWFFSEWVYGTAIPRYDFSYKLAKADSGAVRATVRVRQENVPPGFMMYVPVKVDFGARGVAYVRILVKGPVTEVALPLLPQKPDDIVLDPDESVLADVHTEGWN